MGPAGGGQGDGARPDGSGGEVAAVAYVMMVEF